MEEMPVEEFVEWKYADQMSEIPSDQQLFGMVASAAMNAGFRCPKNPVGWTDFWPEPKPAEGQREKDIKCGERLVAGKRPNQTTNDTDCPVWTT